MLVPASPAESEHFSPWDPPRDPPEVPQPTPGAPRGVRGGCVTDGDSDVAAATPVNAGAVTPRLTGELRPCVTDGDSDVQTGTQISQDPSWHVQHDHLQRRAEVGLSDTGGEEAPLPPGPYGESSEEAC